MMMKAPIYLDYNATTPVDPQVVEEMLPYFSKKFGNASSIQHVFGWDAEEAVELARERVAALMRARPNEIVFTSGATEAINLALQGLAKAYPSKSHIITCESEHSAVLDCCLALEEKGFEISRLKVNTEGLIDPDELKAQIKPDTLLVSIMHANNETGVLQPVEAIAEIARNRGVFFMSDTTQSVGKIPFDAGMVDLAVISAHKMYGPKGVGSLYINKASGIEVNPIIFGGGQEKGYRPGTLNVPGIVGFGKACMLCLENMEVEATRMRKLRAILEDQLSSLSSVQINSQDVKRLPHVTNVTFEEIDGSKLMRSLRGIAVSQGSACTSATIEPSHVLKAMGLSDDQALSSLRIGLGRFTTEEEVSKAFEVIKRAVEKLRLQVS